uniref:F-box domain-containing protein n=1 Tax=Oryza barthii TaxID=65489 RepID=A0A0D3H0W7_9ORYZ
MGAKSDNHSLPPGFGTRPWLVQGSRGDTLTFVDVSDLSLHETVVPEVRGKTCLGCMHGDWLLMLDEPTADCFLLRISSNPRSKIQLPPLRQPLEFLSTYEMLESPESASCTVLVASSTEAEEECYLLHCHPGDEMWTKSVSPYDDISFSSLMRNYGGKIYDFASNLIAIDVIGGKIELQQLGTIKDEEEDSLDVVVTISSSPVEKGVLKGNCVYLVWSSCDSEKPYKFCLDDRTISFHQILPQPTKSWSRAFWAIPASTQSISMPQESTIPNNLLWRKPSKDNPPNDFDEHKEDGQENSPWPWDHLPVELLELIVSNLSLVDRIRFPTVCKAWSEIVPFFGINSSDSGEFLSTFTWQHGKPHWIEQEFEYNVSFPVGYNNPIMFDGKFYCLGRKGNLGVFDPTSNTWRILDKPEPIHVEMDLFEQDHIGREFCYLVDMDGELIPVFLRNANELPRVFKLNRTKISWVEVEDIGGGALFLDYRSSYGVASPDGGNGNRIYFPRYSKDGKPVFYDMNKKTYSPSSFYGVIEPLNYVWVVPNLRKNESTSED